MDDLIRKQDAIDALIELFIQRDKWDNEEGFAQKRGIDAAICEIDVLPSAERHGRWEFIGGYGYQYRCSVCITCAGRKSKFCPNCGAKMDEVEE